MDTCLTSEEVEAFVANSLSPDERRRVESHIARCERCRKAVEARRADMQLAGDIREAYDTATAAAPTRIASIHHSDVSVPPDVAEGYEILHEIHRGGQGVVYKAIQKATKRTVALKVLLEGPYASARQRHRFEREIDLVASLQHPNIVTVYDSGVTQGRHYFAMEYVHGQSERRAKPAWSCG